MDKAGTFEYEIRKDFRNNQIVREVDERRQRDLWQSLGIGALLVMVLLFSAWQHFELLRHGYQIERLQQDRAAEEEINRHLRLEIETLRAPRRIERIATEQLHLIARLFAHGHHTGQLPATARIRPGPLRATAARRHAARLARDGAGAAARLRRSPDDLDHGHRGAAGLSAGHRAR
jgi:cell division protein FtsL